MVTSARVAPGTRRFYLLLSLITLGGLAVRFLYAWRYKWDQGVWGDAFFYHYQANGLAEGEGFMRWIPAGEGQVKIEGASADHPPLFPLYLAAWSLVGLDTFRQHMVASILLGAATVFVVGLAGRTIAGDRVGLVAAGIAAVYANLWVHDALVMSETITILLVAVMVLLAYRFWRAPTLGNGAWLGLVSGLGALTRAEVVLYLPLAFVPLALLARSLDLRRRIRIIVVAGLTAGLVMAPWVLRNMTAFEHRLFLSGGAEITLASANCDITYYGELLGWWSPHCVQDALREDGLHVDQGGPGFPPGDASEQARYWREKAFGYIGDHTGRLPVVAMARLGRVWELYHPGQKVDFDMIEGRTRGAAQLALAQYYLLVGFAVAGVVVLRRNRIPLLPLLSLVAIVSLTVLIAFGNTRYRAPAEIAIVLLAAVGVDALVRRARGEPVVTTGGRPEEPGDEGPGGEEEQIGVGAGVRPGRLAGVVPDEPERIGPPSSG
ncbi:MAG: glycosyltransferase family 39 protein [Acidimicrobiia bacterium]|nr:glycosyltransferase family 39 protein [Acidimicrobiia bacterium]